MGALQREDKIKIAAHALKDFPQIECLVVHRFAPGCYLREMSMPAGAIVVGEMHATEHFNIILKGKCTVATKDGVEVFEAPATFVSEKEVQKVILSHSDVVWQTVHVTKETDLEKLEKELIIPAANLIEIDSIYEKLQEGL